MIDEQELNEKLAKWAGFRQLPVGKSGFHWERCQRVGNWMPPDAKETWQSRTHLPFFTDSLDACFTWLVPCIPKLYEIILRKVERGYQCMIHRKPHYGEDLLIGEGANEALSLCLAIEKLIDKGETSND